MTEIKELVEFLDDLRHTLAGLSWSKYSRVDLISNLVKIKEIVEAEGHTKNYFKGYEDGQNDARSDD